MNITTSSAVGDTWAGKRLLRETKNEDAINIKGDQ